MGMVTSALWTDFDNDGWIDLVVTGEFMPITFIKNEKGKLINNAPSDSHRITPLKTHKVGGTVWLQAILIMMVIWIL